MVNIKISHKWLSKRINCCKEGILKGCGARCCKGFAFYPSKSNALQGRCFYLSDNGCILKLSEKPIKCLLYPLIIKNNVLILHGRAIPSLCKGCYNQCQETIVEKNKDNLIEVFGEDTYNLILKSVKEQKDYEFELSPSLKTQIEFEDKMELENKIPVPRKKNGKNN